MNSRADSLTLFALLPFVAFASCSRDSNLADTMFSNLPPRPTIRWMEAMAAGDDMFTPGAIRASDKALDAFLTDLSGLGAQATRESALPVVERVVKRFNELNLKHDYFVETMEREELYVYFVAALAAVGVTYDDDVTEQWREW
jgi:hypothetical protein